MTPDKAAPPSVWLAISCCACGVISIISIWQIWPWLLLAIPGVVMGHGFLWRIRKYREKDGRKRAWFGLFFSYVTMLLFIGFLRSGSVMGHQSECINNLRQIGVGLEHYIAAQETGSASFPSDIRQVNFANPSVEIERLLSLHSRYTGNWIYFPTARPGDRRAPLLISPLIRNYRAVLFADMSRSFKSPEQVDQLVNASSVPPILIPSPIRK